MRVKNKSWQKSLKVLGNVHVSGTLTVIHETLASTATIVGWLCIFLAAPLSLWHCLAWNTDIGAADVQWRSYHSVDTKYVALNPARMPSAPMVMAILMALHFTDWPDWQLRLTAQYSRSGTHKHTRVIFCTDGVDQRGAPKMAHIKSLFYSKNH